MQRARRLFALFLAALASLLARGAHAGSVPDADKTLSPYFFVPSGDPSIDQLPLKDTSVEASISGVVADVTVRQTYENAGTRPIHATYVFPASTRAAVYGLTMTIGNRRITAKIQERDRAKAEFEQAKREGKSASLLEESRPNVFSMSVANVMPKDTIVVELRYTEHLVPTDGAYELVYPTVVGPRYSSQPETGAARADRFVRSGYTHAGEAPKSTFHFAASLSTGIPIRDLSCSTHQLVPQFDGPARAKMALANNDLFSGNRDLVLRYRLQGDQIGTGLLLYRGATENFFLYTAQPPKSVTPEDVPSREYVFVLDVSGSMNGFPLDTAKKLMRDLFKGMRPTDTFNVVLFADGSRTLAPNSLPVSASNLARALAFIGPQPGGGGTELLTALETAMAIPRVAGVSRSVVLVTDGYIDAESRVFDFIRDHLDGANVFSFGIGSSVNRYLIEGVAHAGQGEPFVVTEPKEAPLAASKFREYIEAPVLTGIKVQFSGFDAYDVEPSKVPDLFASRPVVIFGKWRGDPKGTIELSGHSGRSDYHASLAVDQATPGDDHAALRFLWARTRIARLSDFDRDAGSARATETTSLGLQYSLLTKYTSFLAVQEIVRNPSGEGSDVDQPLPMPLGLSDLAVGEPLTHGAEPELAWVMALASGLALLAWMKARRSSREGMVS